MILGTFNGANIIQCPTQGYSDLKIDANDAVAVSRSPWTQQTYVYPWSTQWWSASITFPAMKRADIYPWQAFLLELQGQTNVFLLGNVTEAKPLGSIPLNSALTLNSVASNSSIVIAGLPVSVNGLLLPGDSIQIGYRLYRVIEQVNSDASGHGTASIFPYLRDNPAVGTAITYQNCQGLFRLTSNKRGWSYSPHAQWGLDPIEAIEAL